MGAYWADALALATTGRIPQDFTPAGYPEVIAIGMRLLPEHRVAGVLVIQILLHVCIAVTTYACLRALRVRTRSALIVALILQLHLELLSSVPKVWDVPYSTLLLLLLELCLLKLANREASLPLLVGTGVSFGLGVFERPNFVLLALPLALALRMRTHSLGRGRVGGKLSRPTVARLFGMPIGTAAVVYAACSFVAFHRLDTPHNGPYNLFAGHNQFTRVSLLSALNAEPSLMPALKADGHAMSDAETHHKAAMPVLNKLAVQYAWTHPKEEIVLPAVKLLTLLRPDSKVHGLHDTQGKVKALLALAVPFWLVVLLWRRRQLDAADRLLVLTAVCYVLPFLLTNSDPRFRTPLDLMLLTHSVSLIETSSSRRRRAKATDHQEEDVVMQQIPDESVSVA